jgi:signal peptidase I
MSPNFSDGDYLLIDELSYRLRNPERGEVIVFKYPNDEKTYFIKRVIGLPGERVVLKENKITIFNEKNPGGEMISETYLPEGTLTSGSKEIKLKEKEYFVLGDNRSYSFDSRMWGVLKEEEIVGMARLRLWPFDSLKAFAAPNYE